MLNGKNGNGNGHHRNGHLNGAQTIPANGVHRDAAIVNGHDPVSSMGHDLLWDGLPPAVTNALGQPLNPNLVSQRKGRAERTYSYIEGHTVIDEANNVFGFGGWGYELAGDVTLRRIENVDAKTGEVRRIHAYSAPVRVTVPGAPPRTDVGFHTVAEETAEGHETACKGAVTDGLKRALRSFGDRFGNGLYGDQPAEEAQGRRTAQRQRGRSGGGSPRPERAPASAGGKSGPVPANHQDESHVRTLRKQLIELGVKQGFDEGQVHAAVKAQTGKTLDKLTAAEMTPLVESAARKLQQIQEAQAA